MQMLAGGALMMFVSLISGEWAHFDIRRVSGLSIGAFLYLIIFGSIVAFTAYNWLLRSVAPTHAATYAYVNPVVAVILGWALAGEPITGGTLLAAGVIVASVVLIITYGKEGDRRPGDSARSDYCVSR
jgi:drug/metabolite transporter (DMT)-like permease